MARRGVRVIAGVARGLRLQVPAGDVVRPTSDRVRESIFSALASRDLLVGASILDLWAGSGALAVEALSRGAERAVLVDRDEEAVGAIRANLETCGFAGRARVVMADVGRFVGGGAPQGAPFDLIFADPPYDTESGTLGDVLLALGANDWSDAGSCTVVECRSGAAPDVPQPWRVVWERAFGDTLVLFLTA